MYLMEGRKLLDAQVFNGRQKLLKLYKRLFSVDFWEFCFYSRFYKYLELKSIRSFCRKNGSQIDKKKELEAMREERKWFFVCYILDIDYSLHSIIHWIAWKHSTQMQWWSRLFIKGEILPSNRLNILPIFLYWVQKSRVEKNNNRSQLLLSCHATQMWIF